MIASGSSHAAHGLIAMAAWRSVAGFQDYGAKPRINTTPFRGLTPAALPDAVGGAALPVGLLRAVR